MRYTHGQGSVPEHAWKFSVIYVPFLALHFWGVAEYHAASSVPPPPPCISYALVQATVGVGTVIILYVIYLCTKCSVAT